MSKDLSVSVLMDFYGELLTDKQRDTLDLYYNRDYSLAEIAEDLDISRQGVRDFIKRGEIQLKEFETALGLLKRFSEINAELDTIKTGLAELKKLPLPQKADSLVEKLLQSAGNIENDL